VQVGLDKLPDLLEVPSAIDLVTDDVSRQVLQLVLIRQEIGRPIALPPGVPAERVAVLREAFDATLKDADFLAEAQKAGMEIEPLSGSQIEAMLGKAYSAPKAIVERMVALIEPAAADAKAK